MLTIALIVLPVVIIGYCIFIAWRKSTDDYTAQREHDLCEQAPVTAAGELSELTDLEVEMHVDRLLREAGLQVPEPRVERRARFNDGAPMRWDAQGEDSTTRRFVESAECERELDEP